MSSYIYVDDSGSMTGRWDEVEAIIGQYRLRGSNPNVYRINNDRIVERIAGSASDQPLGGGAPNIPMLCTHIQGKIGHKVLITDEAVQLTGSDYAMLGRAGIVIREIGRFAPKPRAHWSPKPVITDTVRERAIEHENADNADRDLSADNADRDLSHVRMADLEAIAKVLTKAYPNSDNTDALLDIAGILSDAIHRQKGTNGQ